MVFLERKFTVGNNLYTMRMSRETDVRFSLMKSTYCPSLSHYFLMYKGNTTEPELGVQCNPDFYHLRFNDILDLTINLLCPGKSYSKLYGAESRFNNIH